jgi:hypothetical protein
MPSPRPSWRHRTTRTCGALTAAALSTQHRDLSRSPLNLLLLSAVADQSDALDFGSPRDLPDAYRDRESRDCRHGRANPPQFNESTK